MYVPRRKEKSLADPEIMASSGRVQNVLLGLFFAVSFFLGIGYHLLLWNSGHPASASLQTVYQIVILGGFGALWLVLHHLSRSRRTSPAKSFWTVVLAGLLLLGIGSVVSRVGRPSLILPDAPESVLLGFDLETGVPLVLATIFKMNILALCQIVFGFVLLLRIQELVLVKRSRSSQRNWYLMLGAMGISAISVLSSAPGDPLTEIQTAIIIIAVLFMIVNSFRLSWIVFLSFREKMTTIGLSLLLGLFLALAIGIMDESFLGSWIVPGAYAFLEHYSYPATIFFSEAIVFGALYSSTAFLSLLFHLPTSSEYEQRAGERATMHSLAHLVGQVFESKVLFATIAAAPVEAGSAHSSWLAVPDYQTGTVRPKLVATHGIEPDEVSRLVDSTALFEDVQFSREYLLLEQAPADRRVDAKPGDGLGSLLVVPLVARGEVLGALFAAKEVVRGFERDDVETISIFAAQAAVALDNAHLFEQQVEKERLSRELSIAREVQRRLLPQRLPVVDGLSLHASSVSAYEVGGDYYDFVELPGQRVGVIIGDVSGKGTSAAFYMAEMQGIFRSASHLASSPHEFLKHANRALAESLDRNVFISANYGIFDTLREELTIARAGHCPAAIIGQDGEARFLRSQGLGLGLDRGDLFQKLLVEETIRLQPGDVVAFYTDGVVESRNSEEEEFGYDRLLESLKNYRYEGAVDIHDSVLTDLHEFIGNNTYDDDMTLVIIKWHGVEMDNILSSGMIIEHSTES